MAESYMIPVLERTISVIRLISENKEGLTFTDIQGALVIPKTTLFRILQTLEANNWLSKKGDRYSIGYMMIHFGLSGLSGRNVRLISMPYLEELQKRTTETAHLAVLSGTKSMIIEVCNSNKHIKLTSPIGSLLDLYCTAHGKIFLTYNLKEKLTDYYDSVKLVQRTEHTLTSIAALKEEQKKIIRNGYAIDDREFYDNVRCLAAPVWGPDNEVVAAVGITAIIQDFPLNSIQQIAAHVTDVADKISREMGGLCI